MDGLNTEVTKMGAPTKFLMFDHGGVLDGEMISTPPAPTDLVLDDLGDGVKSVLRNGVTIVQHLNELAEKYNYKIVFHSKNREIDQLRILEQLQKACRAKRIPFPAITAMAVYDTSIYVGVLPSAPRIEANKSHGVMVIGYGVEAEGKSCVRQALMTALNVPKEKYDNCIVFDDGASVISQAKKDGYQAYCIGTQAGTIPLFQAIEDVYKQACTDASTEVTTMSSETDKILADAKKQIDEILENHVHTLLEEEEARHKSSIRNWLYKTWKSFLNIFGIEKINLKKKKWIGISDVNEQIQCFWDGSYGSGAKLMAEMREKHPFLDYARIGSSRTQKALDEVTKIMVDTEKRLAPLFFAAYKKLRDDIISKGFIDIIMPKVLKATDNDSKKLSLDIQPPRHDR